MKSLHKSQHRLAIKILVLKGEFLLYSDNLLGRNKNRTILVKNDTAVTFSFHEWLHSSNFGLNINDFAAKEPVKLIQWVKIAH